MTPRSALVPVGVGVTTLLFASVVGFELVGDEFPTVFVVLPVALVVAALATVGAAGRLASAPGRFVRSSLAGYAAFGYAVVALWFVRYSVASTRSSLAFDVIVLVSAGAAAFVAGFSWAAGDDRES